MLILAHIDLVADELPKLTGLLPHVEHCSCMLYPTEDAATATRVSGVYIPPPRVGRKVTLGRLRKLSAPTFDDCAGDVAPHLLGGDFNPTNWMPMYEEWLRAGSIMELVNPEAPSFATGSALDRFLFAPGSYIPSTFLPQSAVSELTAEEADDCPSYPADVPLCTHMSDHHPIILPIPWDEVDHPSRSSPKIRVSGLSDVG